MANLTQSDYWLQYVLNSLFNPNTTGLYVRLFDNAAVWDHTSSLSAFHESSFPGYVAQQIGTWGAAIFNTTLWQMLAPTLVYTDTGPGPDYVYGYFVTDSGPTNWYWAQLAPSPPITLGSVQPTLGVIPLFGYTDI